MTHQDVNEYLRKNHANLSPKEKRERKQLVLTKGSPSITRSIADALVQKNENVFFLTQPNGDVPLTENHGFGLYYHDCRYLNGYELKIANLPPTVLVSGASTGFSAIIELSNPDIMIGQKNHIPRETLGMKWERVLDGSQKVLFDLIKIQNYNLNEVSFPISLAFRSQFEDIFAIRGLLPIKTGKLAPPVWHNHDLVFEYTGEDGLYRSLSIHFSPPPDREKEASAEYMIHLHPHESQIILASLKITETAQKPSALGQLNQATSPQIVSQDYQRISQEWLKDQMAMKCRELLTKDVLERSILDLRTLRSSANHDHYFAAGVPWFVALFGRDSIISSLQMLAFNFKIAVETLRLLAEYQAHETDPWQDAQPGKILHELRVGELAHLQKIPHSPYYGSVDATPLFLILIAQTSAWTGNLDLFNELKPNIEAALTWIDQYGDSNGDGYVDYQSHSKYGLVNQGWKDSGDAILNADGSLAKPPIALPEVQGYVYRAKLGIANLYEKAGEGSRADQLRKQAEDLRTRFNRDFWSDRLGTYVLALQAQGKPAEVVASNAGQVLWSGIADPDKAQKTAQRLMAEDMFNGWGIRTLSSQVSGYNPIGYHLGTVWPFDTALIAAGFRRYGFDEQALLLFKSLLDAAMLFKNYRLPELFAGFNRAEYQVPVNYPVACHPQAWSAGSIPYLLTTLLGLVPDGFAHKLSVVRPHLPALIGPVEVHNLVVGDASVDILFMPSEQGQVSVDVQKNTGKLDVQVVTDHEEYEF